MKLNLSKFRAGFTLKKQIAPPDISQLAPGDAGEEWVAYLYQKGGFKVIARKYEVFSTKKLGEIDIVCLKRKRLHVVEVKTRRDERFMPLEETINYHKQSLLRRMAKLFVQNHPEYQHYGLQIDIAGVLLDPVDNFVRSVKLIPDAIEDT